MLDVAAVSESSKMNDAGELVVKLKVEVSGPAKCADIQKMIGETLNVANVGGEVLDTAVLVKYTAKQAEKTIEGAGTIVGGKLLQKCVGKLIKIGPAQGKL